jgi:hypothetical protein
MSNEIQLQRKRVATGKDLSRRNFRTTMTYLRGSLHWKRVHLEAIAMLTYYRMENLVFRLLAWRKPCDPQLEKQLEKIDNNSNDQRNYKEHSKQDCENCNSSVFVASVHENPNV